MRVPRIIDPNVRRAYRPSPTSLNLVNEASRKIQAEDFTWNDDFIPTLAYLCLHVIADNFDTTHELFPELEPRDQDHLQELININLDLMKVVKNVDSEVYWSRRYIAHFSKVPFQPHLGWTWKCLYLEQHVRRALERAEPQYRDEEAFEPLLTMCQPFIHVLFITQLRQWKPPNTLLPHELPDKNPIYHISFIPILTQLPNLQELEICYGVNDAGVDYERRMFELAVEDCEHLGEAVRQMKHLKILRLHKSEVGCKHVQELVRHMILNTSLLELNLSHCKIGNLGAKCLGMFLLTHEVLQILRLKNNQIGPEGILGLGWALIQPEGARLQTLDLSMNPLGREGCINLMRTLVRSKIPRNLFVAHCNFDGPTAIFITNMLTVNMSLKNLDVSGNFFGPDGGQKLLESIEQNRQLREMNMQETGIPEETKTEIKRLLKRNWVSGPATSSFNILFLDLLNKMGKMNTESEKELLELVSSNDSTNNEYSLQNYYLGPDYSASASINFSISSKLSEAFLRKFNFLGPKYSSQ